MSIEIKPQSTLEKISVAEQALSEMLEMAYKAKMSGKNVNSQVKRLAAVSQALTASKRSAKMCEQMIIGMDTLRMSVRFLETMWEREDTIRDFSDSNFTTQLEDIINHVEDVDFTQI